MLLPDGNVSCTCLGSSKAIFIELSGLVSGHNLCACVDVLFVFSELALADSPLLGALPSLREMPYIQSIPRVTQRRHLGRLRSHLTLADPHESHEDRTFGLVIFGSCDASDSLSDSPAVIL